MEEPTGIGRETNTMHRINPALFIVLALGTLLTACVGPSATGPSEDRKEAQEMVSDVQTRQDGAAAQTTSPVVLAKRSAR
jgi:hypothetical protein